MEDGKSPTWFNYASLLMKRHDLDYAIKMDSDTGLRVDRFFEFATAYLPLGGTRMYSGKLLWDTWTNASVPYMAGEFYILSRDLAEAVSSQSIYQTNGIINVEDRDTGFIVWKLKPHLISAREAGKNWLWRHKLKQVKAYKKFLHKEEQRLRDMGISVSGGGTAVGANVESPKSNGLWQASWNYFQGRDDDGN